MSNTLLPYVLVPSDDLELYRGAPSIPLQDRGDNKVIDSRPVWLTLYLPQGLGPDVFAAVDNGASVIFPYSVRRRDIEEIFAAAVSWANVFREGSPLPELELQQEIENGFIRQSLIANGNVLLSRTPYADLLETVPLFRVVETANGYELQTRVRVSNPWQEWGEIPKPPPLPRRFWQFQRLARQKVVTLQSRLDGEENWQNEAAFNLPIVEAAGDEVEENPTGKTMTYWVDDYSNFVVSVPYPQIRRKETTVNKNTQFINIQMAIGNQATSAYYQFVDKVEVPTTALTYQAEAQQLYQRFGNSTELLIDFKKLIPKPSPPPQAIPAAPLSQYLCGGVTDFIEALFEDFGAFSIAWEGEKDALDPENNEGAFDFALRRLGRVLKKLPFGIGAVISVAGFIYELASRLPPQWEGEVTAGTLTALAKQSLKEFLFCRLTDAQWQQGQSLTFNDFRAMANFVEEEGIGTDTLTMDGPYPIFAEYLRALAEQNSDASYFFVLGSYLPRASCTFYSCVGWSRTFDFRVATWGWVPAVYNGNPSAEANAEFVSLTGWRGRWVPLVGGGYILLCQIEYIFTSNVIINSVEVEYDATLIVGAPSPLPYSSRYITQNGRQAWINNPGTVVAGQFVTERIEAGQKIQRWSGNFVGNNAAFDVALTLSSTIPPDFPVESLPLIKRITLSGIGPNPFT